MIGRARERCWSDMKERRGGRGSPGKYAEAVGSMARTVQGNKVERVKKERREKEKGVKKSEDLSAEVGVKFEIFITRPWWQNFRGTCIQLP